MSNYISNPNGINNKSFEYFTVTLVYRNNRSIFITLLQQQTD